MVSDIAVFAFVLLFVWLGYKSGFMKSLFGICSYFISIILGLMLYPVVSNVLKNSAVYNTVYNFSEKQTALGFAENTAISGILNKVSSHAAVSLAEFLINIIAFAAVIIICKIIISVILKSVSFLSRVPVISFFNRILGAALGGIKGIVLLYILFLFINFLPHNISNRAVSDINESHIAHKFYNQNIIIDILGKDVTENNG